MARQRIYRCWGSAGSGGDFIVGFNVSVLVLLAVVLLGGVGLFLQHLGFEGDPFNLFHHVGQACEHPIAALS